MGENADVVRAMYASFAEGDVAAVTARMDPKIEWNEAESFPYADGNPYIGPDAVVEGVFGRLGNEWGDWSLEVREVLDAGDAVVATGRYQGTHKGTGQSIDAQFAHVWKLRGGKAVAFQQYTDTAQVRRAMRG